MQIFKHYNFPLNDPSTKAVNITFSSYPGFLESLDDYYLTAPQQLVVIETSISLFNESLYLRVHPESVLSWQRTMVANRMSTSGQQWAEIYAKYQSGTYKFRTLLNLVVANMKLTGSVC